MDLHKCFQNKSLWLPTGNANVTGGDAIEPDLSSREKQAVEAPITNLIYGSHADGTGDAKVNNQVKEPGNRLLASVGHNVSISMNQTNIRGSETASVPVVERPNGKGVENVALMWHSSDIGFANIKPKSSNQAVEVPIMKPESAIVSKVSTFEKCVNDAVKEPHFRSKKDSKIYKDLMHALARPVSSYTLLYELPPPVRKSKTPGKNKMDVPDCNGIMTRFWGSKSKSKSKFKSKSKSKSAFKKISEKKPAMKQTLNRFLSNVKSLTTTGMLDGVPVRYVSSSGKALCGIIKGPSYLCGCSTCNYSKEVNAYEFEHHAGFKTSHPNNHIRFENGKTIHQIVQELKRTPDNMLFDAIQTLTGSPIDQKAFILWRESFNGASHKLEPISVKEQSHHL